MPRWSSGARSRTSAVCSAAWPSGTGAPGGSIFNRLPPRTRSSACRSAPLAGFEPATFPQQGTLSHLELQGPPAPYWPPVLPKEPRGCRRVAEWTCPGSGVSRVVPPYAAGESNLGHPMSTSGASCPRRGHRDQRASGSLTSSHHHPTCAHSLRRCLRTPDTCPYRTAPHACERCCSLTRVHGDGPSTRLGLRVRLGGGRACSNPGVTPAGDRWPGSSGCQGYRPRLRSLCCTPER